MTIYNQNQLKKGMNRTFLLGVFVAALLVISQGLSLSHDQVTPTAVTPTAAPTTTASTTTTTTTAAPTTTTTTAAATSPFTTWDYINGRVQSLNHCFHVLPADEDTKFTWSPSKLHIEGKCGTTDCAFTIVQKTLTFGACTPATLAPPCADYIDRIRRSTHVSLVSNLIKFFSTTDVSVVPNFVLADIPKK